MEFSSVEEDEEEEETMQEQDKSIQEEAITLLEKLPLEKTLEIFDINWYDLLSAEIRDGVYENEELQEKIDMIKSELSK